MGGKTNLRDTEDDVFAIMANANRPARRRCRHHRVFVVTLDTTTADYFDLMGNAQGDKKAVVKALKTYAHARYEAWRKRRGKV